MMNSIPLELIHEILSRLPVKSIARCRCVSKQWRSILCSADFTELFLTKSSTRPSLFFAMKSSKNNNDFLFFSSPQLDGTEDDKSSVAACVQFEFWKHLPLELCGHASGLFLLRTTPISKEYTEHLICNPSTGQYGFLPTVKTGIRSFLGFDPIDKVFKIVSSNAKNSSRRSNVLNVFTLGTGEVEWRKIESPLDHYPMSRGICINGVLYYLAQGPLITSYVVCFDVRSEKFKFMDTEFISVHLPRLINYEGRLGVIGWSPWPRDESLTMWVLENVEKYDWSKQTFTLPPGDKLSGGGCYVAGVTATGEIVLMDDYYQSEPVYVFYYHPGRNTVKRLEVQGFELRGGSKVYAFVDHVDDLTFNMKSWQLHQDVSHRFESFNSFSPLSLLDDV